MRTMWNVMKMLLVLAVVLVGLVSGASYVMRLAPQQDVKITFMDAQPIITQLEKVALLASVRVQVADVLEGCVDGYVRHVKGAWLIKGDALIGVEMSRAHYSIDSTNRIIAMTLPQPCVSQPRVDHTRTKTYNVQRGWFTTRKWESQVCDAAMSQAQQVVEQAAGMAENTQLARERTEQLLISVGRLAGYRVRVRWQHAAAPGDAGSNAVRDIVQTATAMR